MITHQAEKFQINHVRFCKKTKINHKLIFGTVFAGKCGRKCGHFSSLETKIPPTMTDNYL